MEHFLYELIIHFYLHNITIVLLLDIVIVLFIRYYFINTIFSRWLGSLLKTGYERPLELEDLYNVTYSDSSEKLSSDLSRLYIIILLSFVNYYFMSKLFCGILLFMELMYSFVHNFV